MAHLVEIDELTPFRQEAWFQSLLEHNVRHFEQVIGIYRSGLGRAALENFGVNTQQLGGALDGALKRLQGIHLADVMKDFAINPSADFPFDSTPRDYHYGYELPQNHRSLGFNDDLDPHDSGRFAFSADDAKRLGQQFNLLDGHHVPVRNQEHRGTCVAFTVLDMVEILVERNTESADPVYLSRQWLYNRARRYDVQRSSDGISFDNALKALKDCGVFEDYRWPYEPYPDFSFDGAFKNKRSENRLETLAKDEVSIKKYNLLRPPLDCAKICEYLRAGHPVGLSVRVFNLAWQNEYAKATGEISLPLLIFDKDGRERLLDQELSSHAFTLVGYELTESVDDKSHRPGSGLFIFKNNWGEEWGEIANNTLRGYGVLPFEYVSRFGVAACVIDGVKKNGRILDGTELTKELK